MGEIVASYSSDEGLISRKCKELSKLNTKSQIIKLISGKINLKSSDVQ
jgi:hypothetical protein